MRVHDSEVMVVTEDSVNFVTADAAEMMVGNPSTVHIAYSREKDSHVEAYILKCETHA